MPFSGGQTISGAFCLKFGDDDQGTYSDKKRAELREALSELQLIIIDEMSLISADMLYKLDKIRKSSLYRHVVSIDFNINWTSWTHKDPTI